MGRDDIVTPEKAAALIAQGDTIVVFQDYVLKLNSWLDKHPGGRLVILHMVGTDATDEMTAYHMAGTLRSMRAYRIGRKPDGPWPNMTPPIRAAGQKKSATFSDHDEGKPVEQVVDDAELATVQDEKLTKEVDADKSWRPLSPEQMSASEYTDWAVQQGIDEGIRDYPSLEADVQQNIVNRYRAMHQQVHDQGLYECRYGEYAKEMVRYTALFALFIVFLRHEWYFTSAVFLGLFWHQIMFTAHDAGHRAITKNFVFDTLVGMFIADFCCGLSIGWWKSSHNVHHLVTNQPDHDPDIQNVPLFATCPSFFRSIRSTYYEGFLFAWDAVADKMVPYQHYTYYIVMGIARFNLYLLSWLHVLSSKSSGLAGSKAWWIRPTEIAFMSCYWFLFGYCLLWRTLPTWTIRVVFVLISHIITLPLHVQITLSHWGMSTADLGEAESFPQRQLRTTMDVDCPEWLDFIHGGLQFQAVHHLFPRVPRHNLRRVQSLVRQFCDETGIEYSILNFVDGNKKVLGRLSDVGEQVTILLKCQAHMAKTGESGLH